MDTPFWVWMGRTPGRQLLAVDRGFSYAITTHHAPRHHTTTLDLTCETRHGTVVLMETKKKYDFEANPYQNRSLRTAKREVQDSDVISAWNETAARLCEDTAEIERRKAWTCAANGLLIDDLDPLDAADPVCAFETDRRLSGDLFSTIYGPARGRR